MFGAPARCPSFLLSVVRLDADEDGKQKMRDLSEHRRQLGTVESPRGSRMKEVMKEGGDKEVYTI